jgi:DNA ligase-1
MESNNSRLYKEQIVNDIRTRYPKIAEDLDFCFEVLAGKHKLGYTYSYCTNKVEDNLSEQYADYTIKQFVNDVLKSIPPTDDGKILASKYTPELARWFIANLVNREFRLGYSNKDAMVKSYSPMLAKKYPDNVHEGDYYIQEKLDGNRCIAYYNEDSKKWEFMSRSGKPLKVEFNMSWANKEHIFDGEIMTLGHAGSRDFTKTSGVINGKFTDKSQLHYFIYDIVREDRPYKDRKHVLDIYAKHIEDYNLLTAPCWDAEPLNCSILPVLDKVSVYVNPEYNWQLDEWLDKITAQGGEGIMLRDPNATYKCGKRSDALLKYKKVQTMDLRIVDWNEGNGKYAGAIGSFVCETDDGEIKVSVSGMPDELHFGDPDEYIGRIIEVAYFDVSVNSVTQQKSLRFPRLKCFRDDKDTTSIY